MRRLAYSIGILFTPIFLGIGCGAATSVDRDGPAADASIQSDATIDAPGEEGVPVSQFYEAYLRTKCLAQNACTTPVDIDACVDSRVFAYASIEVEELVQGVAAGTVQYDPMAAEEYLQRYSGMQTCPYATFPNPVELSHVFTGTVAQGSECFQTLECAGAAPCDGGGDENFCVQGATCQSHGSIGESCVMGRCAANAFCVGGLCRSGGDGADCTTSAHCTRENYCNTGENKCRPRTGLGTDCSVDDSCDRELGLQCVTNQGVSTCQASVAAGDPCNTNCLNGELYCQGGTATISGFCAAYAQAGEVCDANEATGTPPCRPGIGCDGGTCRLVRTLGETCGDAIGYCATPYVCTAAVGGTCIEWYGRTTNEQCNSNVYCRSGSCSGGLCEAAGDCYE